jgi:hypothetical protein
MKECTMAKFKVDILSRRLPAGTEENHKKTESG